MAHRYITKHARPGLYVPSRGITPRLVVVHCTEGSTAAGAAGWFQNPAARGSAHVVVDDEYVFRCVHDHEIAYHAKGHNTIGLGLEIAGFARWGAAEWLDHKPRLTEAARIHAGWNLKYEIPFEWSTSRGYHSHDGLPGNDHWDPGPNFPWQFYRSEVQRFMGVKEEKELSAKLRNRVERTLRVVVAREGRAPHVDAASWAAVRPMQQLADGMRRPKGLEVSLAWNGTVRRAGGKHGGDPRTLKPVIRTILNRINEGDYS